MKTLGKALLGMAVAGAGALFVWGLLEDEKEKKCYAQSDSESGSSDSYDESYDYDDDEYYDDNDDDDDDYDDYDESDYDKEKIIYTTNQWKGYGKQNYYYNQYRQKGDKVVKYYVNRRKFFDGDENNWETEEREEQSWNINDESMPDWLKKWLDD